MNDAAHRGSNSMPRRQCVLCAGQCRRWCSTELPTTRRERWPRARDAVAADVPVFGPLATRAALQASVRAAVLALAIEVDVEVIRNAADAREQTSDVWMRMEHAVGRRPVFKLLDKALDVDVVVGLSTRATERAAPGAAQRVRTRFETFCSLERTSLRTKVMWYISTSERGKSVMARPSTLRVGSSTRLLWRRGDTSRQLGAHERAAIHTLPRRDDRAHSSSVA